MYLKASKNDTNETANTTKDDGIMWVGIWVADSWQWHKLCNTSATTAQPAVP